MTKFLLAIFAEISKPRNQISKNIQIVISLRQSPKPDTIKAKPASVNAFSKQ